VKVKASEAQMILIAGPCRSGTNDDPGLIKKNVKQMKSYALPIFRAGHIPILGEWLALPLAELGGIKTTGDEVFNEVFHPIAVPMIKQDGGCKIFDYIVYFAYVDSAGVRTPSRSAFRDISQQSPCCDRDLSPRLTRETSPSSEGFSIPCW
jgi:hypothetical protein